MVKSNPVWGVKIKEKRKGKKRPVFLESAADCLTFLQAAEDLSPEHFLVTATLLMTGIRKQELIALRFKSFDLAFGVLRVSEKYVQATGQVVPGTKTGEDEGRAIPIPKALVRIIREAMAKRPTSGPRSFVVAGADGKHRNARYISRLIEDVCKKAKLHCTVHGLRHTYGREFALNTGNKKALQAILGHSSSMTTDLYSDLAGERIRPFGESVSFDLEAEKMRKAEAAIDPVGVKGSGA
ncbi:MAG: site-specific integrase [Bdellovibrionaceae bacterium]|nr:site-specific integrase [Pseudobdellovibrionaceae bacterium]